MGRPAVGLPRPPEYGAHGYMTGSSVTWNLGRDTKGRGKGEKTAAGTLQGLEHVSRKGSAETRDTVKTYESRIL